MLIEFLDVILVDKKPFAENFRLNVQPMNHQLRLKVTYINGEEKVPIDIVVYSWKYKFENLSFNITIDGNEMITKTNFLMKMSYDVFKRHIKLSGTINGRSFKTHVKGIKDLLEVPTKIGLVQFSKFQNVLKTK